MEYLIKFLGIYFACLFKFIAGPVLGSALGYSIWEIVLVTVSGMMSSVLIFTYLGDWIRSEWNIRVTKKRKTFSPKTRRIIRIWQKFGAGGVAVLTPLLLTPIGGTIVLTSFGVKKTKIFSYMFASGLFWSMVLGLSITEILKIPFFNYLLR
ncbi:hypothetical protein [Pararhodonellum marinum]|uniref:hypothetical protein n=1 Tax=Pararhodonellum marinum TaxID=2755358 RepID=UPI00188DE5DF|nr:hypothetical protein [Pararhodonellum marinum]